jgi:hypothetical protein
VDDAPEPIVVPLDALSPDTLRRLLEEFVTRDGTDYGSRERTLEQKVADVRRQLERGEARVVYDPATETANVVVAGR